MAGMGGPPSAAARTSGSGAESGGPVPGPPADPDVFAKAARIPHTVTPAGTSNVTTAHRPPPVHTTSVPRRTPSPSGVPGPGPSSRLASTDVRPTTEPSTPVQRTLARTTPGPRCCHTSPSAVNQNPGQARTGRDVAASSVRTAPPGALPPAAVRTLPGGAVRTLDAARQGS